MREQVRKLLERFTYLMLMPLHKMAVLTLGFYTFCWGVWVGNPFWTVFTQAPLYGTLQHFAPEWIWGVIAIVCGILIMWGAVRMSYKSLISGARVSFVHWFVIALFYFVGDWHNTGGLTSLFIALYSGWIALNVKINHENKHEMEEMFL